MSVCLFTYNNTTAKWIFIKFDSIVVLLKCDFAIFFNWTAVCISAHIARVMQEVFIGAKKSCREKWNTFYAKHPVSVCLVVFKLIKSKRWRDLYFVLYYIYISWLIMLSKDLSTTHAHSVPSLMSPFFLVVFILCNVIVLSLHFVSFFVQKLE